MIAYKIMPGYSSNHNEKDVWKALKDEFELDSLFEFSFMTLEDFNIFKDIYLPV